MTTEIPEVEDALVDVEAYEFVEVDEALVEDAEAHPPLDEWPDPEDYDLSGTPVDEDFFEGIDSE